MGLALISVILCVITVYVFIKTSSRFGVLVKVLIAIVYLWLFTWVSPQIYYIYYWFLFDNLPMQNVMQKLPSLFEILRLIFFSAKQNLSDHSKGLLFWLMIGIGVWQRIKARHQDHE